MRRSKRPHKNENTQISSTSISEAKTINEIEKVLPRPVSATTISFHLKKLREAGLIMTDGHKRGFRAAYKALNIRFNNNGFHVEEK